MWTISVRLYIGHNDDFEITCNLGDRAFPVAAARVLDTERTISPRHVCTVPVSFLPSSQYSSFQPFLSPWLSVVIVKWILSLSHTLIAFVTYLLMRMEARQAAVLTAASAFLRSFSARDVVTVTATSTVESLPENGCSWPNSRTQCGRGFGPRLAT